MRCIVGLFILLFLLQTEFVIAFQHSTPIDDFKTYVDNPEPTDSFCIRDIARAKADIAQGKIIISTLSGFMYSPRYEQELKMLCRKRGYTYYNDSESCIAFEGQTQGCYTLYMDQHLRKTYGKTFLKNLIETADSLFIENLIRSNEVFTYGDFDTDPIAINDYGESVDIPAMKVPEKLKSYLTNYRADTRLSVYLIINKDGLITKAALDQSSLDKPIQTNFERLLLSIVKEHFEANEVYWLPAERYAVPVNAVYAIDIRLHFN